MDNHSHEHPFMAVLLTGLSIASNWLPTIVDIDKEILTPVSHLIGIGSGSCAIILFVITIKKHLKG